MKPMEIVLTIANLLAFAALTVAPLRGSSWARYLTPAALVIAAAQALVEGPRTQMVPAYGLSVAFFAIWLAQSLAPAGSLPGSRLAHLLAGGIGVLGLLVSIVAPVALPVFQLPRPSGTYGIGTLTYHWVDESRHEVFSTNPGDRRELMVQVWYPAKADPAAPRAPYMPDADAFARGFGRAQNKPPFLFSNLKYITTHAVVSAPVAGDQPAYPVLIFLEGATGFRQMNTYQVEELVSHGYIVVGIDQPYGAAAVVFPDGREVLFPPRDQIMALIRQSYMPVEPAPVLNGQVYQDGLIPYFAQDVSFVLDQLAALNRADPILTGKLDLSHTGAFGFSMGGLTASEACRIEARLLACLIMDAPMTTGTVKEGLHQPTMWITRDAEWMRLERKQSGGWPEKEIAVELSSNRAGYQSLPAEAYYVRIPGTFHINFCDIPLWSPAFSWLGYTGPADAHRTHDILRAYSLAFFDRELRGAPAAAFDTLTGKYPEATLEKRSGTAVNGSGTGQTLP